jgi:hypothetical protein
MDNHLAAVHLNLGVLVVADSVRSEYDLDVGGPSQRGGVSCAKGTRGDLQFTAVGSCQDRGRRQERSSTEGGTVVGGDQETHLVGQRVRFHFFSSGDPRADFALHQLPVPGQRRRVEMRWFPFCGLQNLLGTDKENEEWDYLGQSDCDEREHEELHFHDSCT